MARKRKTTSGARAPGSRRKAAGTSRTAKRAATRGARSGASSKAGKAGAKAGSKAAPERAPAEVEALVALMEAHGLTEVEWDLGADGSRRIRLSRGGGTAPAHSAPAAAAPAASSGETPPAAATAEKDAHYAFKSPMVGTFYRANSPEAPPFVSVGDRVGSDTTVCIIEAMKVMNEITPDVEGEIVSIEVENGEAVEYGQTLFLIRTA